LSSSLVDVLETAAIYEQMLDAGCSSGCGLRDTRCGGW